ncbi:MAG: hypothetical protein IIZ16_10725 [Selenomonas sp.]|nr:hypothetical protein [Selenomonas sp.]
MCFSEFFFSVNSNYPIRRKVYTNRFTLCIIQSYGNTAAKIIRIIKLTHKLIIVEKQGETGKLEKKLELPKEIAAPIKKGDVVGKVVCYYNGKRQGAVYLLAAKDVEYYSFWDSIFSWWRNLWKGIF